MIDQAAISSHYPGLLAEIRRRILSAQTRAMLEVNAALIRVYWGNRADAGCTAEERRLGRGGDSRLARDIRYDLPEVKGFSERNIKRMLAFYRDYREVVPQPVAPIEPAGKVPQAVALFSNQALLALPWGHHLLLMEKIKGAARRHWYMQATPSAMPGCCPRRRSAALVTLLRDHKGIPK